MNGGTGNLKTDYYKALYNSPFGNELLLGLAKRAIDAEGLGTQETPDLLCVSFSSNDAIGHCWGPDSQEVLDVTLRSDLIVKDLLEFLDSRVGKGRYVLALTADHGVCPLPEVARSQGKNAGRVSPTLLEIQAGEFLKKTFGPKNGNDRWLEATSGPWFYLNRGLFAQRKLKSADVENALANWLKKQPGIQAAYTRTQLQNGLPNDDAIGQKVRRSFHPDRSGDLVMVLKPYYLLSPVVATGTDHGTPHPYDTHVPLLIYGPRIRKGVRKEPVAPQATAVILARSLGIKPPSGADASPLVNLFERVSP